MVRPFTKYTLSLGLGALSALSVGPAGGVAGCAYTCGEYVECTSRPGLRYVECGGARWEFNDGLGFDSRGLALDYCYCGEGQIECEDGRRVSLCNTVPLDGEAIVAYDGGTSAELQNGAAACLDRPSCNLKTAGCSPNSWYLACSGVYVGSDAQLKSSEAQAIESCNLSGPGVCTKRDAIEDCTELASCPASVACYDDYYENGCSSYPICSRNEDAATCSADPACAWEVY